MKIKILADMANTLPIGRIADAVISPNGQWASCYDNNSSAWMYNNPSTGPAQFEIVPEEDKCATCQLKNVDRDPFACLPGKEITAPPLDHKDIIHNFSLIDVIGAEPESISIRFKK